MNEIDAIDQIIRCKEPEEVLKIWNTYRTSIGLDMCMYGIYSATGLRSRGDLIQCDYPVSYLEEYREREFVRYDAAFIRAQHESGGVFRWSEFENLKKSEQQVFLASADAGLYNGMSMGLHSPLGLKCAISLASSSRSELPPDAQKAIGVIASVMHHRYVELSTQRARNEVTLTASEREIVQLMAEGLPSWQIAELRGVTQKTIEFHAANLYRKLGCSDRLNAVARALYLGLARRDERFLKPRL